MKDASSLAIDLKNAVSRGHEDNFTCLLFRLLLKADSDNTAKLALGFPIEARMIEIYRTRCVYLSELDSGGFRKVDFTGIAITAIVEIEAGQ